MKRFLEYICEERAGTWKENDVSRGLQAIANKEKKDLEVKQVKTIKNVDQQTKNYKTDVEADFVDKSGGKKSTEIEVKTNSYDASVAHWICKYNENGLTIDFPIIKKKHGISNGNDEMFKQSVEDLIQKKERGKIDGFFAFLKEQFQEHYDLIEKSVSDENSKYLKKDGKTIKKNILKNLEYCKIGKFRFPEILKNISLLYNVEDELRSNEYHYFRKQLIPLVKTLPLQDEVLAALNTDGIQQVNEDSLPKSEDQKSKDSLSEEINFVKWLRKEEIGDSTQYDLEKQMKVLEKLISTYKGDEYQNFNYVAMKFSNFVKQYENILSTINVLRKQRKEQKPKNEQNANVKYEEITTLSSLKNYEKVFYLMKQFFQDSKNSKYMFNYKDSAIVIAQGEISKDEGKKGEILEEQEKDGQTLINNLVDCVKEYYGNYMKADYIQIGDELFLIKPESNPLGIPGLRTYDSSLVTKIKYELAFQSIVRYSKNKDKTQKLNEDQENVYNDIELDPYNKITFVMFTVMSQKDNGESGKHVSLDIQDNMDAKGKVKNVSELPNLENVKDIKKRNKNKSNEENGKMNESLDIMKFGKFFERLRIFT